MTSNARFAAMLIGLFLVSAGATSAVLYRKLQRQDCGLRVEQARTIVVEDLRRHGLSEGASRMVETNGACRHGYRYDDGVNTFDDMVSGDWIRGVRQSSQPGLAQR
ncbi:MAG: hypothetical protein E6Q88_06535 [Lysobacteraceae bacterium]|nr:MAG: hypothetical protein E6Q88_06535 [Xanthomonadaceae bacterium]